MSNAGRTSNRILVYSHDAVLLQTRCMVLEQAGFQVDAASNGAEFKERIALAKLPYRLFVVGHTIPAREQSRIVASVLESPTLVYQLPELVSPLELIGHLHELLRDDGSSKPT
jgi:CheY-like chemotaxis protein